MKRQIIDATTKKVLMEISLPHNDAQKWNRALKAYSFDNPVEVVEVKDSALTVVKPSLWQRVKAFFKKLFKIRA